MVKKLKRKSTRKDILLKNRPHTKSLFFDMENVVKKHFSENVFYSNQHALKIEMENMGWNEELKVEDLGCEDSDVKGEIRFSMCFVLKREWFFFLVIYSCKLDWDKIYFKLILNYKQQY